MSSLAIASRGLAKRTFSRGLLTAVIALAPVLAAGQSTAGQTMIPTFSKDIAPILQRSCQNCHRPGGVAPMSFLTFQEVRPWVRSIKARTAAREMPPWFIEKDVGVQQFKDDPSLSDAEIALIGAWADGGAPQGNAADLPAASRFPPVGTWSANTAPDLIVSSPVFSVRAVAPDWWGDIGEAPSGQLEDRYIKAFEIREFQTSTGADGAASSSNDLNRSVVHHSAVNARAEDSAPMDPSCRVSGVTADRAECLPRGNFRYVYNVGMNAFTYPPDLGVLLKARSTIQFNNAHLHAIGRELKAQVQVGFWFHPKGYTPKYARGIARAPGDGELVEIDIPAGMDNVRHDSYTTLPHAARMVNFEPHLHASGKRMCLEAIHPNGYREMINCAGYNHAWVKAYVYQDHVAPLLPKGTIIHIVGWYNNSKSNPRVPDPRNWKGHGNRSIDDMFQTSSEFVYLTEEEFRMELAAREALQRKDPRPPTAQHQGN